MDSSASTYSHPSRLRLSRMKYSSQFINEFSLPGPSIASSEFSDTHSDTQPPQHQPTPRTNNTANNTNNTFASQATPADRLRAVLNRSRLQESASNTTPRVKQLALPTLGSEPDLNESDVERFSVSMAAQPSMAQETLRDLFSRVKDTPPRKSPRRRNSIDASDLDTPAKSRMSSVAKGKQKSASDEEVETWSRNLSMHEDDEENDDDDDDARTVSSRATVFNALRDKLDRSQASSSRLPSFAQSTPRKFYPQTPTTRIQFGNSHSNLLASDYSMARAMKDMDFDTFASEGASNHRPEPRANSSADEISEHLLSSTEEESPQKPPSRPSHPLPPSREIPEYDSSMDEVSNHLLDESQHEADPVPSTTPRPLRSLSGSQPFHYESSMDEISEHLLSEAEAEDDQVFDEPEYAQTPKSSPPKKPRLSALLQRETEAVSRASLSRSLSPSPIGSQNPSPSEKRPLARDLLSRDRTPSPQTTTPQLQPRKFLTPYQNTSLPSSPSHTPPIPPRALPDDHATPKPHSSIPYSSPTRETPITARPTRRDSPVLKHNQPTPGRGSISQELDMSFGSTMDITEASFLQDQNGTEEDTRQKQPTHESMSLTGVFERSEGGQDNSRMSAQDDTGDSSKQSARMDITSLKNWHQGNLFGESQTGMEEEEEQAQIDEGQAMSVSMSLSSVDSLPTSARRPFITEPTRMEPAQSMSVSSLAPLSITSRSVHQRSRVNQPSFNTFPSEIVDEINGQALSMEEEETHLEDDGAINNSDNHGAKTPTPIPTPTPSMMSISSRPSGTWHSAHRRSHTRGNSLLKELQQARADASAMSSQTPMGSHTRDEEEEGEEPERDPRGVHSEEEEEDEEEMRTPTIYIPDLESDTEREDNARFPSMVPSTPSMAIQPSTSTLKTPAPPGAFVATPHNNPRGARRREVEKTPGFRTAASMSTMKTPAPPGAYIATPRANSMPSSTQHQEPEKTWTAMKTPRPPGGWSATPGATVKRPSRLGATVRFDDESGEFLRKDRDHQPGPSVKHEPGGSWESLDEKDVSFDDAVTSTPPLAKTPTQTPSVTPSRYVDAMGREIKMEPEVDEGFSEESKTETDGIGEDEEDEEEEEDIWVPPRDRYDAADRLKSGLAELRSGAEELHKETRYPLFNDREVERLQRLRASSASFSRNREKLMVQLREAKKQTAKAASLPSRRMFNFSTLWKFSIFFIAWMIMTYISSAMRTRMLFLTTYYDPFNPTLYDHIFRSSSGNLYTIPRSISSVYNILAAGYWHAALIELRMIIASCLDYVIDAIGFSSQAHDRALDLVLRWPPT